MLKEIINSGKRPTIGPPAMCLKYFRIFVSINGIPADVFDVINDTLLLLVINELFNVYEKYIINHINDNLNNGWFIGISCLMIPPQEILATSYIDCVPTRDYYYVYCNNGIARFDFGAGNQLIARYELQNIIKLVASKLPRVGTDPRINYIYFNNWD